MRKVILVVGICVLALASMAWADEGLPTPNLRAVTGVNTPPFADRTGDCTLGLLDPALIAYGWDWDGGYHVFKLYLEAANIFEGECVEPLYPLTVNSVDLLLYSFGDSVNLVGQTVTLEVDVECPANTGTTYADQCNGPGDIVASYQVSHTYTPDEASGLDYLLVNVPFTTPVCFDRGFFVGVRLVSWTGASVDDAPAPLSSASSTAADICKIWWYNAQVWGNPAVTSPPCWQEIVSTYVTPWGPWSIYANVTTGAACTPVVCSPCEPLPGDVVEDPIIIGGTSAYHVVDLCDFCPDYDQRFIVGSGFTGSGGDAVFEIAFDPNLPEVCFSITITPLCSDPATFFRVRSWMTDSYGFLYAGTPTFPTFGGSQTYDFTPAGLGCLLPDVYHLYVDARGCCCPVAVTYTGDEALPVELATFGALGGDGEVTVSWRTASERSVEFYELIRDDVSLARIPGKGDNASGHVYNYVDRDVVNGTTYTYRLASHDIGGAVTLHDQVASATPQANVVSDYALDQNYPNPFNPSTSISYSVKDAGLVTLTVYTLDGREVTTLVNSNQSAGRYTVNFNADDLASGVYLYKLSVNGFSATHKMVLMK